MNNGHGDSGTIGGNVSNAQGTPRQATGESAPILAAHQLALRVGLPIGWLWACFYIGSLLPEGWHMRWYGVPYLITCYVGLCLSLMVNRRDVG
jgi:hypothetical protein